MPRKILVVSPAGSAVHFVEGPASSEHELQQVMLGHPQLIPASDLELDGDLLVVGRETTLASGSIDLLCLSKSGELVIVEFKTGPQNPDFRHALAQVIDYGSDIWRFKDWQEFDEGFVHRYLNSSHVDPNFKGCADLRAAAVKAWAISDEEWDLLTSRLNRVLTTGDFHFVVAAQRFTDAMKDTVDFLNETTAAGRYFLVELVRLNGEGQRAYAAQVVQRPGRQSAAGTSSSRASKDQFLARIGDKNYQDAMSELFSMATSLGLTLAWGSKGTSIRLRSPDRDEPISVGWVFLEGEQWTFAKHVTLGVDLNTLPNHPSVIPAVTTYCDAVGAVPGAKPAGGNSKAFTFEPAAFVAEHAQLLELMAALTRDVESLGAPEPSA